MQSNPLLQRPRRSPQHGLLFAVIPPVFVGMIAALVAHADRWSWLGVSHGYGVTFADLRQVTATAECVEREPTWTMGSPTCDPFGRDYNYPSLWARSGALLGVDQSSTEILGWSLIVTFIASIAIISLIAITSTKPVLLVVIICTAAASYPTWLALERGNIDIVVFALVMLASLLVLLRTPFLPAVLLLIASLSKLFPLGAALLLIRDRRVRPGNLWIFAGLMVIGLAVMCSEILLIGQRTPQPRSPSFGASLFFMGIWTRLGLPDPTVWPRLLGVVFFFTTVVFWLLLVRSRRFGLSGPVSALVSSARGDLSASTLILAGGGPLLLAYIAGANFDYRLIFAIPLVAGLGRLAMHSSTLAGVLTSLVLLQLWLTFPVPAWLQHVSDLIWVVLVPALALLLISIARSPREHAPWRIG